MICTIDGEKTKGAIGELFFRGGKQEFALVKRYIHRKTKKKRKYERMGARPIKTDRLATTSDKVSRFKRGN